MNALSSILPKKILVCQLRQLGDVVLTTPSIQLLKHRYPTAELHFLTEKKCVPLVEHNPCIDKIWVVDKKNLSNLIKEVPWYWRVSRNKFNLIIDFQQLPRCRWIVGFSPSAVRLSYTPPWYTRFLYSHSVTPLDGYAAMSKASILIPLGIHWKGEPPRIYLTNEEQISAQRLLTSLGLKPEHILITLDPTHKKFTRRWPTSHYADLLKILVQQYPQIRFLPLWGPGEFQSIHEVIERSALHNNMLLPNTMLTLREMASCINAAKLHIGNCSAPRHIAVAVDTPSVTILGSTSAAWTYPSTMHKHIQSELPCQPCNKNTCAISAKCLHLITPQCASEVILPFLQQLIM